MDFGSIITAMVTPFDANGNIDFDVTSELIEHLIAHGTDGLVVSGTTGESPTLSIEEKIALFKHVVTVVNNRIPVIAGSGDNNTTSSIYLTKEAEKCGVDAVMLVTPYYNRPSQRGLYEHYLAIAQATNLPIMLYNIPSRSGVNMTAETVVKLSKVDNIVSVKEGSGDLDQMTKIIEQTDESFSLYSGDDSITLPALSVGAKGVVSVASHIIGRSMSEMVQAFQAGNTEQAARIHCQSLPVFKGLFAAPSPAPVKAALREFGVDVGSVRLPLVDLTENELANLQQIILPYQK